MVGFEGLFGDGGVGGIDFEGAFFNDGVCGVKGMVVILVEADGAEDD